MDIIISGSLYAKLYFTTEGNKEHIVTIQNINPFNFRSIPALMQAIVDTKLIRTDSGCLIKSDYYEIISENNTVCKF